jgi:hypothetical protein
MRIKIATNATTPAAVKKINRFIALTSDKHGRKEIKEVS